MLVFRPQSLFIQLHDKMATIKVSCQKDTEDIDRAPIGRLVGKIEVGTTIMYSTQLYMNLLKRLIFV